jgi:hypothetical protein
MVRVSEVCLSIRIDGDADRDREEAKHGARRQGRMDAAQVATDADHAAQDRPCRRQTRTGYGRARRRDRAAGQGLHRFGACCGRRDG